MRSPRPRQTANLSESVHQQLNMYALAASAAGVSLLALSQPAEAKIVYTPVHITLRAGDSYYLDFNRDGKWDFKLLNTVCHSCTTKAGTSTQAFAVSGRALSTQNFISVTPTLVSYGPALALNNGTRIPPCRTFPETPACSASAKWFATMAVYNGRTWRGNWAPDVKNRYLALTFHIKGLTHYGWARVSVKLTQHRPRITGILTGFAYETIPNKPIVAGKTHGPDVSVKHATLGELAAGRK